MTTIDIATLATVTGGAGTGEENDERLLGCYEKAAAQEEGVADKQKVCWNRYVKSNWDNFKASPLYNRHKRI